MHCKVDSIRIAYLSHIRPNHATHSFLNAQIKYEPNVPEEDDGPQSSWETVDNSLDAGEGGSADHLRVHSSPSEERHEVRHLWLNSYEGDELFLLRFLCFDGLDLGLCGFKFLLFGFLVVGEELREGVWSYGREARPLLEHLVCGEG